MMKSPFRYPGGKSKVSDLIIDYMPQDTLEYREAFVGGGGVFFGLQSDKFHKTRWINDLNQGLIEVYLAFRDRSEEFLKQCRDIQPPEDGEKEVSTMGTGKKYNARLKECFDSFKYNELMDQALRYFFINRTVWAGRVNYDLAFKSRMYYSNPAGWNIVTRKNFLELVASHVKGTRITRGDYSALLEEPGEKVWIYLDPPYVVDTNFNNGSKLYQYGFSKEEHKRFVDACINTQHRIAISYDDTPEVEKWFSDKKFHIHRHKWIYSGSTMKHKAMGSELLITNYMVPEESTTNWY